MAAGKRRVTYFHDADTMGSYYYGPGHPMKPHRLVRRRESAGMSRIQPTDTDPPRVCTRR